MAKFVVALNEAYGIQRGDAFDWVPAIQEAARDIVELNQYVGMIGYNPETGESAFPRPIAANPDAVWWVEEGIVPEQVIPAVFTPEQIVPEQIFPAYTIPERELDGVITPAIYVPESIVPGYTIPEVNTPEQIIPEHIEPAHWAGDPNKILGDFNTMPTDDGFITVNIDNYEWINFRFLAQVPDTFFYIGGEPRHVGKII